MKEAKVRRRPRAFAGWCVLHYRPQSLSNYYEISKLFWNKYKMILLTQSYLLKLLKEEREFIPGSRLPGACKMDFVY